MQDIEKRQLDNEYFLVERHSAISIEDFNKIYLLKHKPVIISDSLNWPALKRWKSEYLKGIYPHKMVELTIFKPEITEIEQEAEDISLELPSAIDLIYTNRDQKKKHYLMQNSISSNFPELAADIGIPPYADKSNIFNKNLWIGESGVNTRPHYDYSNNFLTQIVGRKRVRLYSPIDSINMYPYSIRDAVLKSNSAVHISRIADTDRLNYALHPNFKFIKYFEGILHPGDLLFIPNGWWHEVKSLDTSISVNFWWKASIRTLLGLQLTNIVCSTFYWHNNIFNKKIREYFDLSEFENDLQISEFALTKNLLCVSAIFLLSYINESFPTLNGSKPLKWKEYLGIATEGKDHLVKHQEILTIIEDIKSYGNFMNK